MTDTDSTITAARMFVRLGVSPERAAQLVTDVASGRLGSKRDGRGQRKPETVNGLLRGNRALLRLRNEYFADFGITKAAEQIAAEGRRYEATRWRVDQLKSADEIADERSRLYAEVLHGRNHFPGRRRVRSVVGK